MNCSHQQSKKEVQKLKEKMKKMNQRICLQKDNNNKALNQKKPHQREIKRKNNF